jgi:hypothetical protein
LCSFIGSLRSDSADLATIDHLLAALRPGGHLVLSLANGQAIARNPSGRHVIERKDTIVVRVDRFDAASRCHTLKMWMLDENDRMRSYVERKRFYWRNEIVRRLGVAGAHAIRCFSEFDGSRFVPERSPHVIYVARKAG